MAANDPETIYTLTPASTALVPSLRDIYQYGTITINDRSAAECYWLDNITGFDDVDLRISEEENPQDDGSLPNPGFYSSRTMTMAGKMIAGDWRSLDVLELKLKNAFLKLVERPLIIIPGETFFGDPEPIVPPTVQINCRKTDKLVVDKQLSSLRYERPFTLSLRASNPTFQSTTEQGPYNLEPTNVSILGTFFDIFFDLEFDTFMDQDGNPAIAADTLEVTNNGNWPAQPRVRFNGPMSDPILINGSNGHKIRLEGFIADGSYIEVDVERGTVTDENGVNAFGWWSTTSDWMRLVGLTDETDGVNELALAVTSFGLGASVDIFFRNTYL